MPKADRFPATINRCVFLCYYERIKHVTYIKYVYLVINRIIVANIFLL